MTTGLWSLMFLHPPGNSLRLHPHLGQSPWSARGSTPRGSRWQVHVSMYTTNVFLVMHVLLNHRISLLIVHCSLPRTLEKLCRRFMVNDWGLFGSRHLCDDFLQQKCLLLPFADTFIKEVTDTVYLSIYTDAINCWHCHGLFVIFRYTFEALLLHGVTN
jgi:hypothetical protein